MTSFMLEAGSMRASWAFPNARASSGSRENQVWLLDSGKREKPDTAAVSGQKTGSLCAGRELSHRVAEVEKERNAHKRGIAWQFTARDARAKLKRLYPVKENALD